jgi:hypothetical protein
MINRLSEENPDFTDFLEGIEEDSQLGKIKSIYDKVLTDDDLKTYLEKISLCKMNDFVENGGLSNLKSVFGEGKDELET